MSLRTPVLDDRSYAQLRDELIARIPVYSPEWTDHHPSDPGITLLELFAYLGETVLYRFNQIPDTTKLAFLDLLQIATRPAEPSTGIVRFETDTPAGVVLDRETQVYAGDIVFQTLDEVTVWPVAARAAIRERVTTELDPDTREYLARTAAAIGTSTEDVAPYRTAFGSHQPLQPGVNPLDPADSIDGSMYIAITADTMDLTAMAGRLLTIGFVPDSAVPTMAERAESPCPGEGLRPPSPPMQWQVCTEVTDPEAADPATADPLWRDLRVAGDTTAGLTQPGVVRLELPAEMADIGVYVPTNLDAIGTGDKPPLVEDLEVAGRLRAWLRVFRPTGGDLPAVLWLDANAAVVEQASTARAEFLGTGTGDPNQVRRLVHPGVLGEIELDVEELGAGRWVPWRQVDDLRGSGVDDRHFTIDRAGGTVSCGDGRRGRVWQIGERVRVRRYRFGGGAAGNVGPGSVKGGPAAVKVGNPLPTRGGADPEPLAGAVDRIPEEFRRRDRAVTVSDFRELAEATPGAGVARAEVLRLFHPRTPTVDVAGAVSVVVWPESDREHPSAPRPDRTMLDAVCRYLDSRRLVTTELYVIPPTYRRIAISVGLAVKPGYGIESVRRWVELVLRQYLAPLPPYGPDGRGWPLGRRVFAPELEAAALQVEGVEFLVPGQVPGSPCLLGLRLAEQQADGSWREPEERSVTLAKWEVPELAAISVVEGPAMDPGASLDPPPPTGPAAPVRSPREVC